MITFSATLRIWPAPRLVGATLVGRCLVRQALAVRCPVHSPLTGRLLIRPALAVQA
jgi:hypothetical protein